MTKCDGTLTAKRRSLCGWKYDKIVILINGESGVGKTTIAQKLCENPEYNLVKSYTNRPPRNKNDVDHNFISDYTAGALLTDADIMASTIYGGYTYFTLAQQFMEGLINVYVVDDLGVVNALNYMHNWKDTGYLTIRVKSNRDCDRKCRDYSFLEDDAFMMVVNNDDSVDDLVEMIDDYIWECIYDE